MARRALGDRRPAGIASCERSSRRQCHLSFREVSGVRTGNTGSMVRSQHNGDARTLLGRLTQRQGRWTTATDGRPQPPPDTDPETRQRTDDPDTRLSMAPNPPPPTPVPAPEPMTKVRNDVDPTQFGNVSEPRPSLRVTEVRAQGAPLGQISVTRVSGTPLGLERRTELSSSPTRTQPAPPPAAPPVDPRTAARSDVVDLDLGRTPTPRPTPPVPTPNTFVRED